jgi:hypothetical protein
MLEWIEGLAGPAFVGAVLWTFAALILLVIVLVIVKLIRSMTFGTFVAGGRNRKTRLAVMDATAVDSHRRLVLVRRDDVEHLILIGGLTDVVVEREIRYGQSPRRSAFTADNGAEPAPRPRVPEPQPARPPVMANAPAPQPDYIQQPPVHRAPPPQPARAPERARPAPPPARAPREQAPPPRPAPPRLPPASMPTSTGAARAPRQPTHSGRSNNLDETLLNELEVTFEAPPPKAAKPIEMTLDDEMTKLLGELASHKR